MSADIAAAGQFIHTHGRLLERRRFDRLFAHGDADAVWRAVDAYRNADGGVGLMEPDIRTPASQPSAVLYAFEVLEEIDHAPAPFTTGALDWLATVTNPDGGVPFVLPSANGYPKAPWWSADADPAPSSLLMTAGVVAASHRLGLDHPWVTTATTYVWNAIKDLTLSDPYTFRYVVHFLDAVPDRERAAAGLDELKERLPEDGVLRVEAGTEGETLGPLEVATRPDRAGRALFPDALIDAALDELEQGQHEDGGWDFTWTAWNPAVAFEWRGMVTIDALTTLRAYGRL
jgi:hypothetical protein